MQGNGRPLDHLAVAWRNESMVVISENIRTLLSGSTSPALAQLIES